MTHPHPLSALVTGRTWQHMVSCAGLVICLFIAGCSDFSFLRGDNDIAAVSRSTINGNQIKDGNATPVPRGRTNKALAKATREENAHIIRAYGGVYSNRRVESQLARIVSRLVAKSEVPSQGFQITILNSPSVNAFALPGGLLYITRGLLVLANDASEVAAVLSHEMAHVTSRHGQERLKQARKTQIVSRAVQDVISDQSTIEAIQQQRQLDFAAFTQSQELEADIIGVKNSGLAGYDPFSAARFLEVMANFQNYRTQATIAKRNEGPNFLSSHPSTPRRVERARLAARQFGAPGIGTKDKEAYLNAIDSMIYGDDPSEGFVRDRSFYHPQLRFTFSVPNGYVIENTQEAVLATAGSGDAVRFDGVELPAGVSLATYLQSGWLNGLDVNSIKMMTVNGAPAASAIARVAEWNFKITIIRTKGSIYRMIFATKSPSTTFDRSVSTTVASFKSLSEREARNLSPLRVQIKRVSKGDTVFSLSRSMKGLVANPDEAFRALNGLKRNRQPKPGDLIKVISDNKTG